MPVTMSYPRAGPTPGARPQPQTDRRAILWAAHRRFLGSIANTGLEHAGFCERLWESFAWISADIPDTEMIERFLAAVPWELAPLAPAAAAQLLAHHGDTLSPQFRLRLEAYLTTHLPTVVNRRFEGRYDHLAAAAACTAALSGAYFQNDEASAAADAILDTAVSLLKRRSYLSEYLSPSYSAVSMLMFADVGAHGATESLRAKGRAIETRLWEEVLSHWHGPSYMLAGPHSRATLRDAAGQLSPLHSVLYCGVGEGITGQVPLGLLYPPPDSLITAGDGDVAVLRSLCCWVAAADYRVPPKAVEEFVVKQDWPGYVVGDAEHACERVFAGASRSSIPPGLPARAAYPPGVTRCATCLAEHFAVGTASRSWMSGSEQDAFSICFSRKRAFGQSLFCRFLAGGRVAAPPVPAGRLTDTAEVIPDQGRAQALQVLNFCVVAYHPKWALAGTPTDRLALTFLFSLHGGTPDEVWLGGEPVAWLGREGVAWRQEETSAPVPQPVYLRVEETFVALFPLTITDLGRPAAVTIRVADRFLLIELINYAAAARQFSAEDLPFVQNGFAALIEDAQGRDFAGWRRAVRLHISDELHGDMRNVRCRCGQTELAMAYHPATEHLLYAAVDGSVVTDKF